MFGTKRRYSFSDIRYKQARAFFALKATLLVFLGYELMAGLFVYSVSTDSDSMSPAIERGDRVIVSPLAYGPTSTLFSGRLPGLGAPARGDIVLVEPSYYPKLSAFEGILDSLIRFFTFRQVSITSGRLHYDRGPGFKRVIAVPGDSLYMKAYQYYVKAPGETHFLSEAEMSGKLYEAPPPELPDGWYEEMPLGGTLASPEKPIVLGQNEYFVASDNRSARDDSADYGPVPLDRIKAKALLRYWPLSRLGSP